MQGPHVKMKAQKTSGHKRPFQGGIRSGNLTHGDEGPSKCDKVFKGDQGHKPTVWSCSSGHSGTDARLEGRKANPNVPLFPYRRGNQRKGMKLNGYQVDTFGLGGGYRKTEIVKGQRRHHSSEQVGRQVDIPGLGVVTGKPK